MSERVRVRLYRVRFGDALLVTIPDRNDEGRSLDRHVLIDVGNVLAGEGGRDEVIADILDDVIATVGPRGVDLYVMTHDHLDHAQGLLYGATLDPPRTFPVDTVWLTRSADPDYYEHFADARQALAFTHAVYADLNRQLDADNKAGREPDPALRVMLANNNPRSTSDCVDYLRTQLTSADRVHYVHREFNTEAPGAHPFRRARLQVWAPEEDASIYYGRFKPMSFNMAAEANGGDDRSSTAAPDGPVPPPGVDARSFYNLVASRERGAVDNALTIDKARNNASVVFSISIGGRVLLFTGDAEVRSWREMRKRHDDPDVDFAFTPVDFLKVSHHGSHNGTPDDELLELLLPTVSGAAGGERPRAGVSTYPDTYNNVPDAATGDRLARRAEVISTVDEGEPSTGDDDRLYEDIFIDLAAD